MNFIQEGDFIHEERWLETLSEIGQAVRWGQDSADSAPSAVKSGGAS